jgi:hypothetical protein
VGAQRTHPPGRPDGPYGKLFGEQLHPDEPDDALWLEAARGGHVLVISGDNLSITTDSLDIGYAGAQGTLVIGTVPIHAWAMDPGPAQPSCPAHVG